jgi:ribosomal protein L3
MGNERVTVKNLKVLQVDEATGIVVVKGTLSGLVKRAEDTVLEQCG